MGSGITLWVRRGQRESDDAQAFLKSHRYAADAVRDLETAGPTGMELDRLVNGLGGDPTLLLDPKTPGFVSAFPAGSVGADPGQVRAALAADAGLYRAPLLLTPKGALAGFRESKWRAFLDIGRGRS